VLSRFASCWLPVVSRVMHVADSGSRPLNLEYARALLSSEAVLRQQASQVFRRFDSDRNGQIDRDELVGLCKTLSDQMGLAMSSYMDLGREIAKFDKSMSGGLDTAEFLELFRHLLAKAVHGGQSKPHISDDFCSDVGVEPRPSLPRSNRSFNAEYVRALMTSEALLRQEAKKSFRRFDKDGNGQVDRDELNALCDYLHSSLHLAAPISLDVGLELSRFDVEGRGGVNELQFLQLFRHLLQRALEALGAPQATRVPQATKQIEACSFAVGDEVWAPFLGDPDGRKYRALVRGFLDCDHGRAVTVRWLRPPCGLHPENYVSGSGFDDTLYTAVPMRDVQLVTTSECIE